MHRQRILLILTIVISASIAIVIQEAQALKDTNWFDNRDFYEKIDDMHMFDKYPYGYPELTVRLVVDEKNRKHVPDIIVEYGSQSEFIEGKEFRGDSKAKVSFDVDEGKKKVCFIVIGHDYSECKKFKSYEDRNEVTFYLR